jgi:hypothetical protein
VTFSGGISMVSWASHSPLPLADAGRAWAISLAGRPSMRASTLVMGPVSERAR